MTTKKTKAINIEGMGKSEAMETLIKGGMGFKDAETYWADNGSKRGGFRSKFYDACLKQAFDKDSFIAFAKKNGATENIINSATHYVGISALVERAKGVTA